MFLKIQRMVALAAILLNGAMSESHPKKKNSSLTKREIEAKKDPILFGVIKDSNKLYYIGDWITEDCNLTWEKFEKKFKSNPDLLKITNKIRIKL